MIYNNNSTKRSDNALIKKKLDLKQSQYKFEVDSDNLKCRLVNPRGTINKIAQIEFKSL